MSEVEECIKITLDISLEWAVSTLDMDVLKWYIDTACV